MKLPNFSGLWNYRGFIVSSVKREFQLKYQNSLLGSAWNVINPLAMIIVYTIIFTEIMRAKLPQVEGDFAYSIYLCSGVLTWGLFSEIISRGQNIFIENANLLKKINFPRLSLPVIVVLNAFLNFIIAFSLFVSFLIFTGNFPGVSFIGVIPVLFVLVLFAVGLGITLGVMNVFFRDVGQFFGIILQFWFWFTPIIYPTSIIPDGFKEFLYYNPMTGIIEAFHQILVMKEFPNYLDLLPGFLIGLFLCIYGLNLFRQHSSEMVDEL